MCIRDSTKIAKREIDDYKFAATVDLFLKDIVSDKYSPCLVLEKDTGKPMYFSCVELTQYKNVAEINILDSISEIIDKYYLTRASQERMKQKSANILKLVHNNIDRCTKKLVMHRENLEKAKMCIRDRTSIAIHKQRDLLKNISVERIMSEFKQLVCGINAVSIIREFRDVIEVFIPEITAMFEFNQNTPYHCYDVWEHTLHSVEMIEPEVDLRFTMLFHDIGKPKVYSEEILENGNTLGHFYACLLYTSGAGRQSLNDKINHSAGIFINKKTDSYISKSDVLAVLYTDKKEILDFTKEYYLDSLTIE